MDSVVPQWSIVVVVSEEGTDCDPRSAVFQPMSPANLVKYGIVKDHKLNLLPDWGMITGKYFFLGFLLLNICCRTITVLTNLHFTMIQCWHYAGILCLLLIVVIVLTTTVLVLRPTKAKLVPQWRIKPKWRSLGEPFCPAECVCSRERCAHVIYYY